MKTKKLVCYNCGGHGFITATYENGQTSAICPVCGGIGSHEIQMTNADRIRAMSDEELAEFLIDLADDGNLRIREWLQQPAEEDDMTDCKHEFVYDELHGEIVCKFCRYVLTADDKRELHRKAFELMEEEEGAD